MIFMNETRPNKRMFEHEGKPLFGGVDALIVAGWTGRDAAAVEHHIRELEAIGVAPPSAVPLFYRVSATLLGPHTAIEVVGEESSGEVEPMIVRAGGRLWLGLASDHTDRALEAHSVALSKQICAKPCASGLWPLDGLDDGPGGETDERAGDGRGAAPPEAGVAGRRERTADETPGRLAERLDALELRSWIADDPASDVWTLYQEGTLAAIRPLAALLAASPLAADAADPAAMLCGTLPAIGGVRPANAFRFELVDPVSNRSLRHEYAVRHLAEVR